MNVLLRTLAGIMFPFLLLLSKAHADEFVKTGDTWTSIDLPGAWGSFAYGTNNVGRTIVGRYADGIYTGYEDLASGTALSVEWPTSATAGCVQSTVSSH
jgi:hypothetical protein